MNRASVAEGFRYIFSRGVLWRNLLIALVVGTVLSVANQLDVVLREPISAQLAVKICINFVIPFVVSSLSAALNRKV